MLQKKNTKRNQKKQRQCSENSWREKSINTIEHDKKTAYKQGTFRKYRNIKQMINNLEALYKPVTVFEWNVRSVVV